MHVLVADDDPLRARVVGEGLRGAGHTFEVAPDTAAALLRLSRGKAEALITSWSIRLEGLELLRRARELLKPGAPLVMLSPHGDARSRELALRAGADAFLVGTADPQEIAALLGRRALAAAPDKAAAAPARPSQPPFPAVAIAASTGGGEAVRALFATPLSRAAAWFVLVHGPAWMFEGFARQLERQTGLPALVAVEGEMVRPGHLYLPAGDLHLELRPGPRLHLSSGPPENYVRPAADPLFRTASLVFGKSLTGVVLTGLGLDAAAGAAAIVQRGGTVLVQDPATAVAPSMPLATAAMLHDLCEKLPLERITEAVNARVQRLAAGRIRSPVT